MSNEQSPPGEPEREPQAPPTDVAGEDSAGGSGPPRQAAKGANDGGVPNVAAARRWAEAFTATNLTVVVLLLQLAIFAYQTRLFFWQAELASADLVERLRGRIDAAAKAAATAERLRISFDAKDHLEGCEEQCLQTNLLDAIVAERSTDIVDWAASGSSVTQAASVVASLRSTLSSLSDSFIRRGVNADQGHVDFVQKNIIPATYCSRVLTPLEAGVWILQEFEALLRPRASENPSPNPLVQGKSRARTLERREELFDEHSRFLD